MTMFKNKRLSSYYVQRRWSFREALKLHFNLSSKMDYFLEFLAIALPLYISDDKQLEILKGYDEDWEKYD